MALFTYTGEPGRVWPSLPVTPELGDVVDWGDATPDPNSWAPAAKKATASRRPDNEADVEVPASEVAPEPDPAAPSPEPAPAAETQE